jgi:hypothetical protein
MGASFARRLICLAVLFFTASSAVACSPVYTIARDLIESSREHRQAESFPTPPREPNVEPYLNRRYRPAMARVLPHTPIGFAHCPAQPDFGGTELVRCTISVGSTAVPILVRYDPANTHLNSTLALSTLRRSSLERSMAQRVKAAYGIVAPVSCPGPQVRFSIPNTRILCHVRTDGALHDAVTAFVIDTADWISLEAQPLPPDEGELRAAFAATHGRRVPGSTIARIILARSPAFGTRPPIDAVKCPRFLNLQNERRSLCSIEDGGTRVDEAVAFIHNRLAYRMAGAYVSMQRIQQVTADVEKLRRGRTVHASIDCAERYFVFVPPEGYHWCEITAPHGYPKRLVITAMDVDGHYDMFFSNFEQSAFEH